jgi:hypothetical protein
MSNQSLPLNTSSQSKKSNNNNNFKKPLPNPHLTTTNPNTNHPNPHSLQTTPNPNHPNPHSQVSNPERLTPQQNFSGDENLSANFIPGSFTLSPLAYRPVGNVTESASTNTIVREKNAAVTRNRFFESGKKRVNVKLSKTGPKVNRSENSLGTLTKRFLDLLQVTSDKTLDLNVVSTTLNVQKRRIYDITNVLEGIGLIQKISKNKIQWTADFKDVYTQNYINQLHKRFTELEIEEQELDKLISLKEKETSELLKNNLQYSYISYNDIKQLPEARDDTLITIKAPNGTKMEVPVTPVNSYPISIRSSNSEPISVSIISPLSPTTDTPNSSLLSDPITPTDHNTVSTSADDSLDIPWLSMDSLSNQSDFEDYYLTVYKAGEGIADIYTENWDDNIQLGDKRFSENENNEQRM